MVLKLVNLDANEHNPYVNIEFNCLNLTQFFCCDKRDKHNRRHAYNVCLVYRQISTFNKDILPPFCSVKFEFLTLINVFPLGQ